VTRSQLQTEVVVDGRVALSSQAPEGGFDRRLPSRLVGDRPTRWRGVDAAGDIDDLWCSREERRGPARLTSYDPVDIPGRVASRKRSPVSPRLESLAKAAPGRQAAARRRRP